MSAEIVILAGLLAFFSIRLPQVEGHSMQPNIEAGNHVLINTLAYDFRLGPIDIHMHAVERGDVVAFVREDAAGGRRVFLKRAIGLPGDSVRIDRGAVFLNGTRLAESYDTIADASSTPAAVVPAGSVFVLGDNRADSDDSRSFGPVSMPSIIGKAYLIIWPLGHVRAIH